VPASGLYANFSLIQNPLAPGSIRRGKLVVPIASKDSWNWFAGVLDLKTSQLQKVTVNLDTDSQWPTWDSEGRILAYVLGTTGRLWKFTPH
jgi:hypothetical protein